VSDFDSYIQEHDSVLRNISQTGVDNVTSLIRETIDNDGIIWLCGNGGSASTASHGACDVGKGMGNKLSKKIRSFSFSDQLPTFTAWSNDTSYGDAFANMAESYMRPKDLLIIISGSGNSENVVQAARRAIALSHRVVVLTGFDGGILKQIVQDGVHVPSNDMQVVENVHLLLIHWFLKAI